MMQKPWFKIIIWLITISFFFLATAIIISSLAPSPDEDKSMLYMSGMMNAMDSSLMGLSMSMESDIYLKTIVKKASDFTLPFILYSMAAALLVKLRRSQIDR
ncbi:MAG: hypothetical protein K0R80_1408 [Clostridia bacterium]|jgi:hypothetical protein|nr:hypothetical protein [Clostridia bacterium]